MIKHVVLFKFKEKVNEQDKNTAIKMLKDLKNKIPEIIEWEIGIQRQNLEGFYDVAQISSFRLNYKNKSSLISNIYI